MGGLEEKIFKDCDKKPLTWWQYIYIFMLWQHGEKELEKFLEFLNCYHPTIKFTADYSWEEIHFLHVESVKQITNLSLIYILNQQTCINIYMVAPVTCITLKNPYLPHEKINRCLIDINRCLTDIFRI